MCIVMCMRTNIDLNDDLLHRAMQYTQVKTKKGVIEEALTVYVGVKENEKRRAVYRDRLEDLEKRLADVRLRRSPIELLREDRNRG